MKEKEIPQKIVEEFKAIVNFSMGHGTSMIDNKSCEKITTLRDRCITIGGNAILLLRQTFKAILRAFDEIKKNYKSFCVEAKNRANSIVKTETDALIKKLYVKA